MLIILEKKIQLLRIFIILSIIITMIGTTSAQIVDSDYNGINDSEEISNSQLSISTIASEPLSLNVNGKMLVDRTHSNCFDTSGFTNYLITHGWIVDQLTTGPIDINKLQGYDIFLIPQASSSFSSSEINDIKIYVEQGGGIWLFNEYNRFTTANSVSIEFGVTFNNDMVEDSTNNVDGHIFWPLIHILEIHPITESVGSFGYYAGSSLNVNSPSKIIAKGDVDANSDYYNSYPPIMAAVEYGAGKGVFYGDMTPLHPSYFPGELTDNEKLLLINIVNWLAGENSGNQPPIADAGPDQTVFSGDIVYFDGSNSYDPDGTIVSYHWDFGYGTTEEGKIVNHRFRGTMDSTKLYTITLTIKDDTGATGQDIVIANVKQLEKKVEVYDPWAIPFIDNLPIADVTAYYNWIGRSDDNKKNIYVISKLNLNTNEYTGVYNVDILSGDSNIIFTIPLWSDQGIVWSNIHKTYAPPCISSDDPIFPCKAIYIENEIYVGPEVHDSDILKITATGFSGFHFSFGPSIPPGFRVSDSAYFSPDSHPINFPDDDLDLTFAHLCSPGELRVYDSLGRVTGLVNGNIKEEIPESSYFDEMVMIPVSSDSFKYEVHGTDEGSYGLVVATVNDGESINFVSTDIPTSANSIHQYTIDWDALSQGEEGVTIQIDINGDGIIEETITSDDILTIDEFILQTETSIDINPDTLNLKSKGEWITAYIEFPTGYNVGEIELSSINLVSESGDIISSIDLSDPATIGDYDNNVISDLMVKFSRFDVVNYFGVTDSTEGIGNDVMVKMSISGELNDGTQFEGSDSIRLIINGK
jgi:PKD domain